MARTCVHLISVVTVTYNSRAVIGDCLSRVDRLLGPQAQVVVVDNASTDGALDVVAGTAPRARVIALTQNEGFGRACNRAIDYVDAEWVLFLNPDVRLTRLIVPSQPPRPFGVAAGLACSIDGVDGQFLVWRETGAREDYLRETWMRFLPPPVAHAWPTRRRPADWASAGLMLVRRDEFRQVGGFDERFFMYYEDRDLGRRFRSAGFPIRCDGDLAGVHLPGQSTDAKRSTREAFSLAGWLEYTGIWRGQMAANNAAERALCVLTTLATWLGRATPWRRGRFKAEEVEQILDVLEHLEAYLPDEGNPVLPHAREALATARRSARRRKNYGQANA